MSKLAKLDEVKSGFIISSKFMVVARRSDSFGYTGIARFESGCYFLCRKRPLYTFPFPEMRRSIRNCEL